MRLGIQNNSFKITQTQKKQLQVLKKSIHAYKRNLAKNRHTKGKSHWNIRYGEINISNVKK